MKTLYYFMYHLVSHFVSHGYPVQVHSTLDVLYQYKNFYSESAPFSRYKVPFNPLISAYFGHKIDIVAPPSRFLADLSLSNDSPV